jgi:hypothetical protein
MRGNEWMGEGSGSLENLVLFVIIVVALVFVFGRGRMK